MGDLIEYVSPSPTQSGNARPLPVREDCWSEEATATLIEAWGRRYVELNRGNLRQKDWQEVADAVNALHGLSKKTHRTDVQCKNRIDTVKKKYKIEKARISSSGGGGGLASPWVFYDRLEALIGSSSSSSSAGKKASPSPSVSPLSPPVALPLPYKKTPSPVVAAVALPQKRPAERLDEGYFRRNYSEVAAAAAAAGVDDEEEDEEERDEDRDSEEDEGEGMRRLAKAIERFGEVYQRVEAEKLRQMVDLEKQRMQFAKDLEVQRLKMFMDTQVQLERIKHVKRSGSDDAELGKWHLFALDIFSGGLE
ncbi:trihelix transcription factor ENAP2-like isoform X1 [Syzygium oleosum]|uniref:trihelix transcription factor ENAP2-like isoform X1 n=1 Tax=Syzygium oleosum TaxID=219896 RepID=UPI0024BBAAC6|nr:trihelix transcription factor ENAP2-like isoform X1 [Syzygium oleosum]